MVSSANFYYYGFLADPSEKKSEKIAEKLLEIVQSIQLDLKYEKMNITYLQENMLWDYIT